jgi:hypothetical protein
MSRIQSLHVASEILQLDAKINYLIIFNFEINEKNLKIGQNYTRHG